MRFVPILIGLVLAGCGGNDSGTAPSGMPSASVRSHLDELLTLLQTHSVHARIIEWDRVRADVFAAAGGAVAIPNAYPAIELALKSLNDYETYYVGHNRTVLGLHEQDFTGCGAPPAAPRVPANIGYVKVSGCPCQGAQADHFAETVQQAIREADRPGLIGWIVDLRENGGGNMWPMIAGLGPILGEGIMGWIVYNNREYEREYREGGAMSFGDTFSRVSMPYTLIRPRPKVAVITSRNTNSAGEAIVVWFRGRPATRSFGEPTCGHHHLLESFRMTNGAMLTVKTASNADRLRRQYVGPITPDETYINWVEAVDKAVAWLGGNE